MEPVMVTRTADSRRVQLIAAPLVAALALLMAGTAAAQGRQARMSADLVDHLRAGSQAIDVIVHGDRATVDALAARYNVAVKKYLKDGAVLRVTAGQLDAIRQD